MSAHSFSVSMLNQKLILSRVFPPLHPLAKTYHVSAHQGTAGDLLGSVSWSSPYDSMCHFALIKITKLKTDDSHRCWETETYKQFPFLGAIFFSFGWSSFDQLGVCVAHVLMKTVGGSWPSAVQEAVAWRKSSLGHWPDLIKWQGGLL